MLVGLIGFLSACEKDLPGKSGGKVAIIFSIGGTASEAPRGFGLREPERSEVEIENEENYFLSATLTPDEEGLRAVTTSALIEGQKVHLEAYYTSSGALAGEADYHANSAGQLVLDDPDSPLEVDPADGPFDFSAYSYYKSTSTLSLTGIDPRTDDLIWGNVTNQPITATEAGRTVSFNLKHKFVKVRVKISVSKIAGATITDIGTVKIESQKTVDLTVKDGALADNVDVGALDVSSSLATTDNITLTSDYYVFHPSPTKVTISSIKIKVGSVETTYSTLFATFTQGVTAGGSYTLAVDLEKFGFAHSNIYWDGERLTFDKSGVVPDSKYFQGVFFRWGSLVGISPVGDDAASMTAYIPNISTGTWDGTKTISASFGSWNNILYPTEEGAAVYGSSENYLYDHDNFSSYQGDICKFLTGGAWRIPNSSELSGSYSPFISGNISSNAAGTGSITAGYTGSFATNVVFFPASGYHDFFNGVPGDYVGERTYYWSGSRYMDLALAISNPHLSVAVPRKEGCSIRCIKN
jgi:hypothetical protein